MCTPLDIRLTLIQVGIVSEKLSTSEVAKLLGLHRPNLQRAIRNGMLPAPALMRVGGIKIRLWSTSDLEKARKALKKSKES